ncbi:hypothetical protein Scep_021732 [Stephania cephalantha]|uniref:Small multi-drug export n=1 Tax=Stephania cephalantha TaxID=152367 RepID=A0AAP0FC12_9MAGN
MAAIAVPSSSTIFSPSIDHKRNLTLTPHPYFFPSKPLFKPIHSSSIPSPNSFFFPPTFASPNPTLLTKQQLDSSEELFLSIDDALPRRRPIKFVFWVLVCASLSLAFQAAFGAKAHAAAPAAAAANSIRASNFGLRVASALRGSGWPAEAIVFALATLPVVELRGAIPVGYWLQLKPGLLTVLSVLGNMVPVPFIVLYLKKFASFLARSSPSASRFLDLLFKNAREKAGPVEEFQWLGLMLFVAVPFPGTGAWTGAIIASILDMPFWSAISANFFGVVLAGLLVNLLVNLGLKYAIVTGIVLFLISTFMWSILRNVKKSLSSTN